MVWIEKARKKGKTNSIISLRNKYNERVLKYNQDPKLCKNCKNPIPYNKRINVFCSKSCSATHNNHIRILIKPTKPKKIAIIKQNKKYYCKNCGEILNRRKVFCTRKCEGIFRTRSKFLKNVEIPGYIPHKSTLRRYLTRTREHQCENCKNDVWNGKPIPLECHHIDGDFRNNKDENLSLLCPNCHAQTDNYKGLNEKDGRLRTGRGTSKQDRLYKEKRQEFKNQKQI